MAIYLARLDSEAEPVNPRERLSNAKAERQNLSQSWTRGEEYEPECRGLWQL